MTRLQGLCLALIVAEWVLGGAIAAQRLRRPTAPVPEMLGADPVAADQIRSMAANCATAEQWADLGATYVATGYFPEAEVCFRVAARMERSNAEFAFRHAFTLERVGRLEEATEQYASAIACKHPRTADCWYYIGKNSLRRENPAAAAAAFERAGNLAGARYELAWLHAREGRLADAEADAARLAEEFPDAYEPVALRYRVALARGDKETADRLADAFVRRPSPLPIPLAEEIKWVFAVANGIGRDRLFRDAGREMHSGRPGNAEAYLRQALAAGWSPEIADKLADVLFALGRPREAAAELTEAVERGGPAFGLLWRLGQAYDALGQPELALQMWERAARSATGAGAKGLWEDLGQRYLRIGNAPQAQFFRVKALVADGAEALDARNPTAATATLTQAVALDPHHSHAWFYLGEAHRANGRPSDARPAYERCLQIDPNHGRAIRALRLLDK